MAQDSHGSFTLLGRPETQAWTDGTLSGGNSGLDASPRKHIGAATRMNHGSRPKTAKVELPWTRWAKHDVL